MATADELARLEAPEFDFEMKFFIGGAYGLTDLTGISIGASYNPNAITTLDGDHDEDDTTITVDDSSNFTTGTICIAPEASGEYYEIIAYGTNVSDVFGDLTRPATDDAARLRHSDGADVSEWLEITHLVTDVPTLTIGEQNNIIDWKASITGTGFNSVLIANDRSLLAMWRFRPASGVLGTWTDWSVAFVGYLNGVKPYDTHQKEKKWAAHIGSIWQYISRTDIKGSVYGKTNVAAGASVTASSTLDDPFAEYGTGEYLGWADDFSPSLVVDENLDTLWISDGIPDITPDTPAQSGITINEIYLRPETWFDDELQWLEIFMYPIGETNLRLNGYAIVNADTAWKWAGWDPPDDRRIPYNNYILIEPYGAEIGSVPSGSTGFFILTNNKPLFLDRWQSIDEGIVFDWRPWIIGSFSIDPQKDFLALHRTGFYCESVTWFGDSVAYPSWASYNYTGDTQTNGTYWTGDVIDSNTSNLPLGHSIRRNPTGTKATPEHDGYYAIDQNPSPGLYYTGEGEWLDIDLGTMNIQLDADIDDSSTIELVVTTTLGLTTSGYVLLDEEIIGYATRDAANNKLLTLTRGAFSTTPAAHYKGSASEIGQYEDGGTTYNHKIDLIQIKRKPVLNDGGDAFVVPYAFHVMSSIYTNPITPDDEDWGLPEGGGGWRDYWWLLFAPPRNASTVWQRAITPHRARHVLVRIREMSDGGRAKVNEVSIYAPTGTLILTSDDDRDNEWEGTWTGEILEHILITLFGLDPEDVEVIVGGAPIFYLPITKGKAGTSIQEILKLTGTVLIFRLDNTIAHDWSLFNSAYGWPAVDVAWDRDNARNVSIDIEPGHNVKQVILRAMNQFTDTIMEAKYPGVPNAVGEEITENRIIIGDVVELYLLAETIYRNKSGSVTATIVPVGPAEFIRPGDRHTLTWDLDTGSTLYEGRNFVVTQVSYSIRFAKVSEGNYTPPAWTCSVQLRELR